MRSPRMLLVLATVLISATAIAAGTAASRAEAPLRAPVIHERFTALPCSGAPNARSTFQQLGCAETDVLRTDRRIDAAAARVFARLGDDAARRRFLRAAAAWLAYRRADCASRSDIFEGGSQAPVLAAQCQAARNRTRLVDLRSFFR